MGRGSTRILERSFQAVNQDSSSTLAEQQPRLLRAAWVVERSGCAHAGGGLLIHQGRIERVLRDAGAVDRCEAESGLIAQDWSEFVVAPGWINAHAHLELSALHQRLRPGANFPSWIRALIGERSQISAQQWTQACEQSARELLASGTTRVVDIDSMGLASTALEAWPARRIAMHEVLDAQDSARSSAALERALKCIDAAQAPKELAERPGLAPHAPYTLSAGLAQQLAAAARARGLLLSIHWSESPEEEEFLEQARGPFAGLLPAVPGGRGLQRLEAAGLLGPRTILVHGNSALPTERQDLRGKCAGLVHCPGTHAWFGRPRFALEAWLASDVPLALGTDSLASHTQLSMQLELATLLEQHPTLDPWQAHALATLGGARVLGLVGEEGALEPGCRADFGVYCCAPQRSEDLVRALCDPGNPPARVYCAGRLVHTSEKSRRL